MIYIPQFYQGQIFSVLVEIASSKTLPGIDIHGVSFRESHEQGSKIAKALMFHGWKLPLRKFTVIMQSPLPNLPQVGICDLGIIFALLEAASLIQTPQNIPLVVMGTITLTGQIEPLQYSIPYLQFLKNTQKKVLIANLSRIFPWNAQGDACLIKILPQTYLIHLPNLQGAQILKALGLLKSLVNSPTQLGETPRLENLKPNKDIAVPQKPFSALEKAVKYGQPVLSYYHSIEDLQKQKKIFTQFIAQQLFQVLPEQQNKLNPESFFCTFNGSINSLNYKLIIQKIPYYASLANGLPFYLQIENLMPEEFAYFLKLQIFRKNYQSAIHLLMPTCPNCLAKFNPCTCTLYQRHQYQKLLNKLRPYFAFEVTDLKDLEPRG